MKVRFKKSTKLLRLTDAPKVGALYHVVWGDSRGVVGRCIEVHLASQTATMMSPKSKAVWKFPVNFSDLRHTRKTQAKILQKAK